MKRREFFPRMIAGSAIVAVMPAMFTSCEKDDTEGPDNNNSNNNPRTIDLNDANYTGLKSVGGFAYKESYIVINTGNDTFVAFSSKCTHSGCTVNYSAANNNLPCPCHGSVFSMDGSVLQGPASSPLTKYPVAKSGNILTIG